MKNDSKQERVEEFRRMAIRGRQDWRFEVKDAPKAAPVQEASFSLRKSSRAPKSFDEIYDLLDALEQMFGSLSEQAKKFSEDMQNEFSDAAGTDDIGEHARELASDLAKDALEYTLQFDKAIRVLYDAIQAKYQSGGEF